MILTFFMVLVLAMSSDMMPFRQRFRISGTIDLDLEPIDVPNVQGGTVVPGPVPIWPQNTCIGCAVGQTCQIFYKSCLVNKDCLLMNEECKYVPCEPMKVCIGEIVQTENSSRVAEEQSITDSVNIYSTGFQESMSTSVAQTNNMESVHSLTTSVATNINTAEVSVLTISEAIDSTISTSAEDILSTSVAIDTTITISADDTVSTSIAIDTTISTSADDTLSTSVAIDSSMNTSGDDILSISVAIYSSMNTSGDDILSTSVAIDTTISTSADDILSTSLAIDTTISTSADDLLSTSVAIESSMNTSTEDILSTSVSINFSISKPAQDTLSTSAATTINILEEDVLSTSAATTINTLELDVVSTSEAITINTPEVDVLSTYLSIDSSSTAVDSLSTYTPNNIISLPIETINSSLTNTITNDASADTRSLTIGCFDCPEGHSCHTVYPESPMSMEECLSDQQRFTNIKCPFPQSAAIEKCVPVTSLTLQISQFSASFELIQTSFSNQIWMKASDEFFSIDASVYNFPGQNLNTHDFQILSSVPSPFGEQSNQISATIQNLDSPTEKPLNTMLYLPSSAEPFSGLSTNIQDLYRRDHSISPTKTTSGQTMDPQVLITTTAKLDPCKGTCLPGQVCEKYYPPCAPPSEACLRALQSNPNVDCGWSRCNPFYICVPGETAEVPTTQKSDEDHMENSSKSYLSFNPSSDLVVHSDQNIASSSESDFEIVSTEDINNLRNTFVTYQVINSLHNSLLNSFSESPSQLLNEIPITSHDISAQSATPPLKESYVIEPNLLPILSLSLSTDLNEVQITKHVTVAFNTYTQTDNTESISGYLPKGYTAVTGDTIDPDTVSDVPIIQVSNTEFNILSVANEILNQINESTVLLIQSESDTMMSTTTPNLIETTLDIESIYSNLHALQTTQKTDAPTIIERTLDFNFPSHQQKQDSGTDELKISPSTTQNTAPELTFSYNDDQSVTSQTLQNEHINELRDLSFPFGPASVTQTSLTSSTLPDLQTSSSEPLSNDDNTGSGVASESPALMLDRNKETTFPWYTFDYSKAELIEQTNSVQPMT